MNNEIISETSLLTVTLHEFRMSDVEDPQLYAAGPLLGWEKSEAGAWALTNCSEVPVFYCRPDHMGLGYMVTIVGKLTAKQQTFWCLKYGKN